MTIEELLNSLKSDNKYLPNTKDTWKRIRDKDNFDELGFSDKSEKEAFLSQWIEENPYTDCK